MTDTTSPVSSLADQIKQWLFTPWSIVVIAPLLVYALDPGNIGPFLAFAMSALVSTAPYVFFAVLLIAFLKAAGAESQLAKAFEGKEHQMILAAAFFGGLAPFCSCEVIPFIAALLAVGTPLSAVMAFWLASPLIDPPTFFITAAALGWPFAVGKTLSAVALGLLGGYTIKYLAKTGFADNPVRVDGAAGRCGCGPSPFTGRPQWAFWKEEHRVDTFKSEFGTNALFLLKWLALAYTLESLLVSYVPAQLIASVVGGEGVLPVATAALVGMPAYLNGYVAPALLAGLMEQGMSAGAAMAFMIAGAVSSIPAMAAVWSLVKPRIFAAYLFFGIFGAIVFGLIFQAALTL